MRISEAEARVERTPLARPYAIARGTITAVDHLIVKLRDDAGHVGVGAGSLGVGAMAPLPPSSLAFLIGANLGALPALLRELARRLPAAPVARAAVDIALHDLHARALGLSLGDVLGRWHESLATSITIGIKPTDETLAEADEHIGRGFRILKVRIGRSLDDDLERLTRLRERVGPAVSIRADANEGYTVEETRRFFAATDRLDIEVLEQPVAAAATAELCSLPAPMRDRVAADEAVQDLKDALRLAVPPRPAGIFNLKLMKCGGLGPARAMATIAEVTGVSLMWGCMDESRIGIAAALHAALASPATRYLDLDGSFDLARDVAAGGFVVEDGCLRPTGGPGLGVSLRD